MHRPSVCLLLSLTLLACSDDARRNTTGAIVTEGVVDVFAMKVGDCFNDELSEPREVTTTVGEVPGVPCEEPHDNEIFASYRIALDEFPGDEALSSLARKGCVQRFASFVGRSYDTSILDTFALYPTRRSWVQQKDRDVMCAIYREDEEKMTGTMRDAEI
jgi:hypothetical protein